MLTTNEMAAVSGRGRTAVEPEARKNFVRAAAKS
jgi:hypothetical protein